MAQYKDLADKSEDERIQEIGNTVMLTGAVVAIFVDDEPGKPERYIRKLLKRFPVRIIERCKGPIPRVATIKLGPIGAGHGTDD